MEERNYWNQDTQIQLVRVMINKTTFVHCEYA